MLWPTVSQPVYLGVKHPLVIQLWVCGALSDERTGLSFTIAAGLRQRSHSCVRVLRFSWPCFTVSVSRLPKLGDQVLIFKSPRNRMAKLYPKPLEFLLVASYNSQGYDGDILTSPPQESYESVSRLNCSPSSVQLFLASFSSISMTRICIPF
jgi:hypothetical protein